MSDASAFPPAEDPARVGSYPAVAKAGGGFVWGGVLEYEEAAGFARATPGSEAPLALVVQEEYIDGPEDGVYVHVRRRRVAEWPVEFLRRPRRTPETIPAFLAPDAPPNRLDVLRGLAD